MRNRPLAIHENILPQENTEQPQRGKINDFTEEKLGRHQYQDEHPRIWKESLISTGSCQECMASAWSPGTSADTARVQSTEWKIVKKMRQAKTEEAFQIEGDP